MATLLIVDDDPTVLDALYELFSGDHECHIASTAEEALATLDSCDYDVVVTDFAMPGLSGEALLGFAKTHCPDTPVIFISGAIDAERAARLKVQGAFDYLLKPFELPEIYGKVARALEHRRRRRGRD